MIEAPRSGQHVVFSGNFRGEGGMHGWCVPVPRATRHSFNGTELASYAGALDGGRLSDDGKVFVSFARAWSFICGEEPEELAWSARFYNGRGRLLATVYDEGAHFDEGAMARDGSLFVYYTTREMEGGEWEARLVARSRKGEVVWTHDVTGWYLSGVCGIAVADRGRYTAVALLSSEMWGRETRLLDRDGRLVGRLPVESPEGFHFSRSGDVLLVREGQRLWRGDTRSATTVWEHPVHGEEYWSSDADISEDGRRAAVSAQLTPGVEGYRPEDWPSTSYAEVVDTVTGDHLLRIVIPRDAELEAEVPAYWGPKVRLSNDGTHLLIATSRTLSLYRELPRPPARSLRSPRLLPP
jgi:hypothetical protein